MAGLVPAIPLREARHCQPERDCRAKPGNDELGCVIRSPFAVIPAERLKGASAGIPGSPAAAFFIGKPGYPRLRGGRLGFRIGSPRIKSGNVRNDRPV
jgi:hypothetical protein